MSHLSVSSHIKTKPASSIGAFISARECQQLKQAFAERYPDQVPTVFISKELILNSIAGLSNVSGIRFTYGLDDPNTPSTRRIILVPSVNRSNGESGMIPHMGVSEYLCDNGESIGFEKLLTLLGNHVTNFSRVRAEIPVLKIPRGYFWGIKKLMKLLAVENCAGVVFHFGFNEALHTACKQFQSVLEAVDASHKSLLTFLEFGQCPPPCAGTEEVGIDICAATIAAEKFSKEADSELNRLRAFRDNWLLQQDNGQALYEMYYFLSAPIVEEIQTRQEQEDIWQEVYYDGFSKCLELIEQNRNDEAKAFYVTMMDSLVKQFLIR